MKLFRFDIGTAHAVTQFNSHNASIVSLARADGAYRVDCMHIAPEGTVGYHQAAMAQLFMVVQGSGWVCGTDQVHHPIAAQQAAFWQSGEWHAAGSATGMVAIVVESEQLDPTPWMVAM